MPIDLSEPGSPGWWLAKLNAARQHRNLGTGWSPEIRHRRHKRPGLDLLDDYLRGDPPLPNIAIGWRDLYVGLIREARMNYAELVVSSAAQRMIPRGWTTAEDSDTGGDQLANRIATANQLPLRISDAIRLMFTFGSSYLLVGPPDPTTEMPVITEEDPRETFTADHPSGRGARAALKVGRDEWTAEELAWVYVPGSLRVARRQPGNYGTDGWEWDERLSSDYPAGFEDLVPVVHLRNRDGRGEYEPHLDVLNRINSEIFRRVTVALVQAFRQRAAIGLPLTTDGKPLEKDESNLARYEDVFTSDPFSVWQLPPNASVWESTPVSIDGLRAAVKDDVMQLAGVTATPLYSLVPDAANASAQGATIQREGLIYRVEDRQRRVDWPLNWSMGLAFRYLGEAGRADVLSIRTLWQPTERYSLAEKAQAASAAHASGLPDELIYRDIWQYGPEELDRITSARNADLQRRAAEQILINGDQTPPVTGAPAAAAPTPAAAAAPVFSDAS